MKLLYHKEKTINCESFIDRDNVRKILGTLLTSTIVFLSDFFILMRALTRGGGGGGGASRGRALEALLR